MLTVLAYAGVFVLGFACGAIVSYIRTSRFYLRMTRSRYD
jgi:hypothetical protein